MKKNIIVNLQFEGIHNWPDCPIDEVSFLKYPHRHIFYICGKKEVTHNDRDIEIIQLKRQMSDHLKYEIDSDLGSTSCESLAERLLNDFDLDYCSVLEDNENGAEIWKK